MNGDPIKKAEKIALGKLHNIFQKGKNAGHRTEKLIEITFLARGKKYKGLFTFSFRKDETSKMDIIIFENPCSYLQYTYGKNYPYSTRINANRNKEACFTPRLEGPSADVLQILSTKIRLQVPEHGPITIRDEAEKDGVYISKAKLIRGLPSIYEKYGYESEGINYIKEQVKNVKVGILSEDLKEILEDKAGIPIADNTSLIDVMKRIKPENELIEGSEPQVYISNIIYNKVYNHIYTHASLARFFLPSEPEFILVFKEYSDAWKTIRDKVQILDILDVTELRKFSFVQLPDNIRNKVIKIDDDISDDDPVVDILNRIKEKNASFAQNIYKYMDNYLKKRQQVEILMNIPLNATHETYRVGDLSDDVKEQFYEIFYNYFKLLGKTPIEIDDSMYIVDVLHNLKEEVPDFHFDELYILLYNTFGGQKWENQNQVGGKRKTLRKHHKCKRPCKTKRRAKKN